MCRVTVTSNYRFSPFYGSRQHVDIPIFPFLIFTYVPDNMLVRSVTIAHKQKGQIFQVNTKLFVL